MEPGMTVQKVACASCGASISVPSDIDLLTCAYCGSHLIIRKGEGYIASKLAEQASSAFRFQPSLTRYQSIIDVLIDSSRYTRVYFDYDTQLPVPYRGIAFRKRSALQEKPGKGRELHKKWADVVGVHGTACDIVVEEELEPGYGKVQQDIDIITRCRYLWADSQLFTLSQPCLFVLVDSRGSATLASVRDDVGTFKRIVVCEKSKFETMFREHFPVR